MSATLLSTRPPWYDVAPIPPNVNYPGVKGNYMTVPLSLPADADVDWYADFVIPKWRGSGGFVRPCSFPFFLSWTATAFHVQMLCSDATVATLTLANATMAAAGCPNEPGKRIQMRGRWNHTSDLLSVDFRDPSFDPGWADILGGWTLISFLAFAGKQSPTTSTSWNLGGAAASEPMFGRTYRVILVVNGAVVHDVDPRYAGGEPTPTSWDTSTSHITVNRLPRLDKVFLPAVAGNDLTIPDAADLDMTGDIGMVARLRVSSLAPGSSGRIIGKLVADPQRAWNWQWHTTGGLRFRWSTDGTAANEFTIGSNAIPGLVITNGWSQWFWLAGMFDANNGAAGRTLTTWYSLDDTDDDLAVTWALVNAAVQGTATSIAATTEPVRMGAGGGGADIELRYCSIRNSIGAGGAVGGTAVFTLDRSIGCNATDTTLTAMSAETITVNKSGGTPTALTTIDDPITITAVETPGVQRGHPVGLDDWRIATEVAIPTEEGGIIGTLIVDTDVIGDLEWVDLSKRLRGENWSRGSDSPGGPPRTGVLELEIDNRDRAWTPWANDLSAKYRAPGTLLRIGVFNATDWIPQFAGSVEVWNMQTDAHGRECFVHITVQEMTGLLGTITGRTVTSQGAGETPGQRCRRLLDAADTFPGGFYDELQSPWTLLATTMAANRLAELEVTAFSGDGYFRSHRSGYGLLEAVNPALHPDYNPPVTFRVGTFVLDTDTLGATVDPNPAWWQIRHSSYYFKGIKIVPDEPGASAPDATGRVTVFLAYDADSLVGANDLDLIVNDVRLKSETGTEQVSEDLASQGQYKITKTLRRSDLKNDTDSNVLTIAQRIKNRRANAVLRIESVDLWGRPGNLFGMMVLDIGDPITIETPDGFVKAGRIAGVDHSVTPRSEAAVIWTTTLVLETDS